MENNKLFFAPTPDVHTIHFNNALGVADKVNKYISIINSVVYYLSTIFKSKFLKSCLNYQANFQFNEKHINREPHILRLLSIISKKNHSLGIPQWLF